MENIINVAIELGYIEVAENTLVPIDAINKYNNDQIVIITTGSQGEPMSALSRMASAEHKKVNIVEGDTIIISATPIPGNEKLVSKIVNQLFKKRCRSYLWFCRKYSCFWACMSRRIKTYANFNKTKELYTSSW